jgi:hypothetical protein
VSIIFGYKGSGNVEEKVLAVGGYKMYWGFLIKAVIVLP